MDEDLRDTNCDSHRLFVYDRLNVLRVADRGHLRWCVDFVKHEVSGGLLASSLGFGGVATIPPPPKIVGPPAIRSLSNHFGLTLGCFGVTSG